MLSKFAQVSKEGKYVQPPHAKLGYGGVSDPQYYRLTLLTWGTLTDALYTKQHDKRVWMESC